MTPEDLSTVQGSWAEFRRLRDPMLAALSARFGAVSASPTAAAQRASWLFCAVDELVGLLSAPSLLAERARDVGEAWPKSLTAPSFAIEGRAWMAAAGECLASWSEATEASWRQAWLLLSEVLAAETLAPFADEPPGCDGPDRTPQTPSR